ncbi:MAG: HlyC/CorC family transporter [Phycisphaerae bacterium]|nr:HlyC/CorC family transporter [Phycisphaerae bacterium]
MTAPALWVLLVAAPLGTLLSALHYALQDYSVVRLQAIVEARGRSSLIEGILADVPGHVLATGFLRSVCNVATTVSAVLLFNVFRVVQRGEASGVALNAPSLLAGTVFACIIVYFFGIVLPMSIAEHAGERLLCAFAALLRLVHALAWPLRAISFVDSAVKRLVGAEHLTKEEQIQEEIISAVAEGERGGQLDENERDMIESIVGFKDRTVEEIMTPRTEIEALELTDDLASIQKFIEERGHSRIPVYQGDLDHIAGVLYAKDLIKYLGSDPTTFRLKPVLRRPVWVPETKPLTDLLYELRVRKVHLAIVLDEYGGTTGLVTFEDLLEEIVGEIQDEYEPNTDTVPAIDVNHADRSADIDARAYIIDANEQLEPLNISIPEGEDYDTVGGFALSRFGHIPVAGETLETDEFRVTVLKAEPTRILRVRVAAVELPAEDASDEAHPPIADQQPTSRATTESHPA